jgi:hypothetical protein
LTPKRVRLRRLTVLHPLDGLAEGDAGLLGLADVADRFEVHELAETKDIKHGRVIPADAD